MAQSDRRRATPRSCRSPARSGSPTWRRTPRPRTSTLTDEDLARIDEAAPAGAAVGRPLPGHVHRAPLSARPAAARRGWRAVHPSPSSSPGRPSSARSACSWSPGVASTLARRRIGLVHLVRRRRPGGAAARAGRGRRWRRWTATRPADTPTFLGYLSGVVLVPVAGVLWARTERDPLGGHACWPWRARRRRHGLATARALGGHRCLRTARWARRPTAGSGASGAAAGCWSRSTPSSRSPPAPGPPCSWPPASTRRRSPTCCRRSPRRSTSSRRSPWPGRPRRTAGRAGRDHRRAGRRARRRHAVARRPGGLPRRDGLVGLRPRLPLRPAGAAGAGPALLLRRRRRPVGALAQKSRRRSRHRRSRRHRSPPPPPKSPPPSPSSPPPSPGAVLVALGVGLLVAAAEQAAVAHAGVEQRVGDGGADDQAADGAQQAAADHAAHAQARRSRRRSRRARTHRRSRRARTRRRSRGRSRRARAPACPAAASPPGWPRGRGSPGRRCAVARRPARRRPAAPAPAAAGRW